MFLNTATWDDPDKSLGVDNLLNPPAVAPVRTHGYPPPSTIIKSSSPSKLKVANLHEIYYL